jgi:hypothetical protein
VPVSGRSRTDIATAEGPLLTRTTPKRIVQSSKEKYPRSDHPSFQWTRFQAASRSACSGVR